ncbi:hypothetical protein [Pelagicoccus sp. SDUM812005]|uniref:hypothetical protein n=1 Tax=Pelagicoccus sp. SDUM812005 TaxID=3041257 RepID=UPI00280EA188|nr:hypothetical protein [Pelagicoccus sp. SDUM812005]MDQ8181752.1 hypothetical protein [Pelagicoccus sp. SDUM812005]
MAKPIVYLVLACKGSDQFRVIADLVEFGTSEEEKSAFYFSSRDAEEVESDFAVKHRSVSTGAYAFEDGRLTLEVDETADLVFIAADGLGDPADFVEAFHAWLPDSGCELGRVITVLHSDLAIGNKDAFPWFDCCIHFSDVVLLSCREKVGNKEIKAFLDRYEELCFPCLWEYVKKGRVGNPSLVLDTQSRRISRIFDVPEVFEDDGEEDEWEEDIAGDVTKDPFLKTVSGGKRAKELPDIGTFL